MIIINTKLICITYFVKQKLEICQHYFYKLKFRQPMPSYHNIGDIIPK